MKLSQDSYEARELQWQLYTKAGNHRMQANLYLEAQQAYNRALELAHLLLEEAQSSNNHSGLTTMSQIRDSNVVDILLWLLRQRQRFRVEGISMLPLLQPGDEVLVNRRAYRRMLPSVEDVVVVWSPEQPDIRLIKRVISIHQSGACFLQGDNPSRSRDSRTFGWVEPHLILGRVTSRFL
ncbi:MAG: nickel-type superoxide dismutase maturation protease [Xenococcaceae cyanobacterium]